jgi:hypothetical protein
MSDAPKSAFDLAMERLKADDLASGAGEAAPPTDAQKAEIAELRQIHAAKMAEREILFHDALKRTYDEALRARLEEEYRIDRHRLEDDLGRNIEKMRRGR